MKLKVFDSQKEAACELAKVVAGQIAGKKCNVLLPSGNDANVFYSELAKEVDLSEGNFGNVLFIQAEELKPIPKFHPVSFACQIKKNLEGPLGKNINIHYLDGADEKFVKSINLDVAIIGVNDAGDVLGMSPSVYEEKNYINNIDIPLLKWEFYLRKNNFLDKAQEIEKPNLVSIGSKRLVESPYLYVLSTGKNKSPAISDVLEERFETTIGHLVIDRDSKSMPVDIFIDELALNKSK